MKLRQPRHALPPTSADKLISCANEVSNNAKLALERAKQSMDAAKKNQEMVQSQFNKAREEVKAAEKCLAESEKRHEVIDIDDIDNDTPQKDANSNKKRKVSMSPQGNSNNNEVVVLSDSPPRRSNNNSSRSPALSFAERQQLERLRLDRLAQSRREQQQQMINSNRIVLSGCGTSVVNGTYTKTGTLCEGSPTYSKAGRYGGNSEVIVIFCRKRANSRNKYWHIGISGKPVFFYTSVRAVGGGPNAGSTELPPMHQLGWMVRETDTGELPLPKMST